MIGGGAIGLACAYYLRQQRHEVVIVDKGVPGEGCSRGNLGWICPSLSQPLPAPGLVKSSIKWMMQKESPLYIKPSAMPSLSPWLYQFWKNCNEQTYAKGYKASLEFGRNTLRLFDQLENDGVEFEMHRKGMLIVCLEEALIPHELDDLRGVEEYGLPTPQVLTAQQVLALEPNLTKKIAGGILLPAERHVRPESLTGGLAKWLKKNGVQFKTETEVKELHRRENSIIGARCDEGWIEADAFLLTAGAWSGQLAKQLEYHIPMTAGKGYSITISAPSLPFTHPLHLADAKAGITPFEGALRIGGTMELSGINTNIDKQRAQNIRTSIARYVDDELKGANEFVWTGMRPMTPDSLPVLGRIPGWKNGFVATGHAMMGISLSLPTGRVMADLIGRGETDIDLGYFSPGRFNNDPSLQNDTARESGHN